MNEQFLAHYQAVRDDGRLQKRFTAKHVVLIVCAVLVFTLAIMGFVQLLLHAQKDTEEYALCYDYLVSSDAFRQMDAEESRIRMNQYSISTHYTPEDAVSQTVEIGFLVNFRPFTVVCHKEQDVWVVCEECTPFD